MKADRENDPETVDHIVITRIKYGDKICLVNLEKYGSRGAVTRVENQGSIYWITHKIWYGGMFSLLRDE